MSIMPAVKRENLFWTLSMLLLLAGLCTPNQVFAEDYNVNASVPYPAPTQAATIVTPAANTVVNNAQQTVTGACEQLNPPTVVSIWRGGVLLGSAPCNSGGYSVAGVLSPGPNTLIARTANASQIYGPDSSGRVVTFELPAAPIEPLPPAVTQPTSPAQQTTAINAGSSNNLTLTTAVPFSLLSTTDEVSVQVVVQGGQQPYVVQINWGDGSVESFQVSTPGTYEYKHSYQAKKIYQVGIKVRDVLGSYTEYAYTVITGQRANTASDGSKTTNVPGVRKATTHDQGWLKGYYIALGLFIIFLVVSSYRLGFRRAKKRYQKEAEEARQVKKVVKKS